MFWVVQDDLFQENQRSVLLNTLDRFSIPHQVVSITAQSEIIPEVTHTGRIITNGSILLSRIANQRGWQPGSLFNDQFSYAVWHQHLKPYLLNRDAEFTTIASARPHLDEVFVRPVLDDKTFTGRTMTREAFRAWQTGVMTGRGSLSPETEIILSPVKAIGQEHRHFIVDGTVISSSRYKLGGAANYNPAVDPHVVAFAALTANLWRPARAFVLDTYIAGEEIGIVELGGICHAGFYAADVQKIVMALDAL